MSDQYPPPGDQGDQQPGWQNPPQQPPHGTPPYGSQPYGWQPYGATGGWQPGWGAPPPNHPNALTSLILGIVSLVLCSGLLSPIAWYLGAKAVKEIDAAPHQYGGRSEANAGKIIGIIGTVILILVALLVVGLFVLIMIGISAGPDYYEDSYGSALRSLTVLR